MPDLLHYHQDHGKIGVLTAIANKEQESAMIEQDNLDPLTAGVYSIGEAARYCRVHPNTVSSWFRHGNRPALFDSDYAKLDLGRVLSFYDLIDVYIVAQFRARGISMQRIRAAYTALKKRLKTRHPFCHKGLLTGGRDIFAILDEHLTEAVSGQQLFKAFVMEHLKEIDFDKATSLASRWRIANNVELKPGVSLGKPVIENTRVLADVLAQSYFANDKNAAFVADLFQVRAADVMSAVKFEQDLKRRKKAA